MTDLERIEKKIDLVMEGQNHHFQSLYANFNDTPIGFKQSYFAFMDCIDRYKKLNDSKICYHVDAHRNLQTNQDGWIIWRYSEGHQDKAVEVAWFDCEDKAQKAMDALKESC